MAHQSKSVGNYCGNECTWSMRQHYFTVWWPPILGQGPPARSGGIASVDLVATLIIGCQIWDTENVYSLNRVTHAHIRGIVNDLVLLYAGPNPAATTKLNLPQFNEGLEQRPIHRSGQCRSHAGGTICVRRGSACSPYKTRGKNSERGVCGHGRVTKRQHWGW